MKRFAVAFILVGVALALLLGVARGFDATSASIFVLIVAFGALGIAVIKRSDPTVVGPATCAECGGVISPNAPYCKHCGASTGSE